MTASLHFPRTMKAAILVEQKKPLIIGEVTLPSTLDVGQVLVKIHFSGICGSQLGEIEGVKGPDRFLPHLLGHEASATVLAVGPGVRHVKPEDTVVVHWRKGLGIEASPAKFTWKGEPLNAGAVTTFSEYSIVSENRVTRISKEADLEVAALFGCAVTTGFGVIENNARLRIGESLIVWGAGGVGLNIIQAAHLVSAYPIIAVDLYDERLELAQKMGATHTLNARTQAFQPFFEGVMPSKQVDCFIDNTGNPEIIQMGYGLTGPQGRVILVGVPRQDQNINLHSLPLHFGKVLTGSHGGESQPHLDIPRYHQLYEKGRIQLKELLTHHFSLDDINLAMDGMRNGSVSGRCLILGTPA